MKKNMVCVAILFTGLLLCITLMTGGGVMQRIALLFRMSNRIS